jgi:hypothetical protein
VLFILFVIYYIIIHYDYYYMKEINCKYAVREYEVRPPTKKEGNRLLVPEDILLRRTLGTKLNSVA